jgi:hypothetical protein
MLDFEKRFARRQTQLQDQPVVVEGVMHGTEAVIRHAMQEKLKIVLVVNKMDRLILELSLGGGRQSRHSRNKRVDLFNGMLDFEKRFARRQTQLQDLKPQLDRSRRLVPPLS